MNLYRRILTLALFFCFVLSINAQRIKIFVLNEHNKPLSAASISIVGSTYGAHTNNEGKVIIKNIPLGKREIKVSYLGYKSESIKINILKDTDASFYITLKPENILSEVEVFGERHIQPEKLSLITRLPLRPSEQIQSISVISDKVITEQGALTVTDAIRNVPGVTLFGSYGGIRESMSTRGYRGVPVLKNGVRIDSDFRTASLTSDMQGVESIQVLKGSAAVTQGLGNDLGSAGGVINVVTKTPKFINTGDVSLRGGSWGQFRPTFDVQGILDEDRTVALRVNGAFERADSYKEKVSKERVYINPSLEWRPDSKTTITLEMDYLNDNTTPDRGTINLAADSINALYDIGKKFLGFDTDNVDTKIMTFGARLSREITDKVSVRASYFGATNKVDNTGAGALRVVADQPSNIRSRSLTRSISEDNNYVFQLDLIGKDLYTGSVKHTFQVGFDYKTSNTNSRTYGHYKKNKKTGKIEFITGVPIDRINVYEPINNTLRMPSASQFGVSKDSLWVAGNSTETNASAYGIMFQEVMTINKYLKAIMGLRYSYSSNSSKTAIGETTGDAWNPIVGLMVSPIEHINLFGSYTTTTDLRSASKIKEDGSTLGPSKSKQWELGVKSDWLDDRLRFNFTYFHIKNKDIAYGVLDHNGDATPYSGLAGNLKRSGIETELSGRILTNLQVMMGWAYLDAKYEDSPVYVNGSSPMNAPKHTLNSWVYYTVNKGLLKDLSIGVGAYYVGDRPVNEYITKRSNANIHDTQPGVKPFDMPSYTTINAQLAYSYGPITTRLFLNNIFDKIGYNSYYRGGFINQTDPRNFSASVSYRF